MNDQNEPGLDLQIDIGRFQARAELERRLIALDKELKEVKKEIARLNGSIVADLVRCGLHSVPLESGELISKRRSVHVSKRGEFPMPVAVEALREAGILSAITVGYSASTLKAYVNEREQEILDSGEIPGKPEELLPESLRKIFRVFEETKVVVTGARGSNTKKES